MGQTNNAAGGRGNVLGLLAMSTMQQEQHAARKAEVATGRGNAPQPATQDQGNTMRVPTQPQAASRRLSQ